ncbi:MAG: hypothetical protein MUC63_00075 [Planctomycetes bacterium]|jgi:hypothetical protein|nr:hypothetical protein [Planctomycetota bacterium]
MKAKTVAFLLVASFLALPAFAGEKKSADYEVHEWGFVFANPPSDKNPLDDFLKQLPGKIRQVSVPGATQGQTSDPGDVTGQPAGGNNGQGQGATQPGNANPRNPGAGQGGGSQGNPRAGGPDGSGLTGGGPVSGGPAMNGGGIEGTNPWRWGEPFMWFYSRNPLQIQLRVDLGVFQPLCWWPQGVDEGNSIYWKHLNLSRFMPGGKQLEDMGKASEVAKWIDKARDVNASFVGSGNKVEKFLMYEFLGLYWSDLRVKKDSAGLWAENRGERPIQGVYLISDELQEGRAHFLSRLDNDQEPKRAGSEGWQEVDFKASLVQTLVDAGLNRDEALCLIRVLCAQDGFFKSKGVRAIHLLDRPTIESISRLEFDPEPTDVKRVWLMLVWDACTYNGISSFLNDGKAYQEIVDAVKNGGGREDVVDGFLKRLASQRAKESKGNGRG